MSSFAVKTYKITVFEHPNADAIEVAQIEGYQSIVPKGLYKTGDTIAYIPEQAIVPDEIIEELGLVGKLTGKKRNRVKAIKLRGVLSQGLIYPNKGWKVGKDVTEELGITKYTPPIPTELDGEVDFLGTKYTVKYDIENIKNYPNVLNENHIVEVTEKIHGTFVQVIAFPENYEMASVAQEMLFDGRWSVASKGLGAKGLVFIDTEKNKSNTYVKTIKKLSIHKKAQAMADEFNNVVILMGEVFGNVQDLKYGVQGHDFRLFDIAIGTDRDLTFLDSPHVREMCEKYNIAQVPVLYRGQFSQEMVDTYTSGLETVSGTESNIREGIVIKPFLEAEAECGRVILKSISDQYLLRKSGTEYN
jgi:RNA ligase (TIGR02306 family)